MAGTPKLFGAPANTGTPQIYRVTETAPDANVLFDEVPGTFDETPGLFDEGGQGS